MRASLVEVEPRCVRDVLAAVLKVNIEAGRRNFAAWEAVPSAVYSAFSDLLVRIKLIDVNFK